MALPTSIQNKLTTIAENEQRVYDSGVEQGEGNIWDIIQGVGGIRETYDYAFRLWYGNYIHPKYKVVPKRGTGAISQNLRLVFEYSKVKKLESKYFDFSNISFNASATNTQSIYGFFRYCSELEEIEDIGLGAGGYYATYNSCSKLHTIAVMRCVKEGEYTSPFSQCYELQNIKFVGEIGKSITFQYSPLLSIDSLTAPEEQFTIMVAGVETTEMRMGLFRALYDYTGTGEEYTQTLTLHADSKALLDNNDVVIDGVPWREYIENKKWNLA